MPWSTSPSSIFVGCSPRLDPGWVIGAHVWREPHAQPIVECGYQRMIPDTITPLKGLFLATMAQVYPEDRGTNYAIRLGREVALQVASRPWRPTAKPMLNDGEAISTGGLGRVCFPPKGSLQDRPYGAFFGASNSISRFPAFNSNLSSTVNRLSTSDRKFSEV